MESRHNRNVVFLRTDLYVGVPFFYFLFYRGDSTRLLLGDWKKFSATEAYAIFRDCLVEDNARRTIAGLWRARRLQLLAKRRPLVRLDSRFVHFFLSLLHERLLFNVDYPCLMLKLHYVLSLMIQFRIFTYNFFRKTVLNIWVWVWVCLLPFVL